MHDLFQTPQVMLGLLEHMQDGVVVLDARGAIVFVNEAMCCITGFAREELLGTSAPFAYWPPEGVAAMGAAFQRVLAGEHVRPELVFMRKDGARIDVLVAPSELRDAAGHVVAYCATVQDISERKASARAQVESEQRWRSIAENPFDFVVVIDRKFRYTYVNHTAPGVTRESLIGRATPFDFVDPAQHAAMRQAFEHTFETGRATIYDVHVPQLDRWYGSIVGPILEDGAVTSLSILTRDITDQKRAEAALRNAEQQVREAHKMESVGTLAGGIAHDLNNLLTPILAYADLAQRALAQDHAAHAHLQGIGSAALRARDLVQRVLLFSRRQESQKGVLDLRQSVREDIKLLHASLPSSIEILLDLGVEPVPVLADRGQLSQVLTNLATNALQVMHETGGRLVITLQQVQLAAQDTRPLPPSGPGTYAALTVTDSGPGMDEETRRRVFEPFFTTKPSGTGTGLGLSIVHGIVREHGGDVSVCSKPGHGAAFTVRLPVAFGEAAALEPALPRRPSQSPRPLRVLYVDDEPSVAAVAGEALKRGGHQPTIMTNAQLALERLQQNPNAFDVLVTDQTMPLMLGTVLIAKVRAIKPGMPCVLTTGLDDEQTQRRAAAVGVSDVLLKPFSIDSLLRSVDRAADSVRVESA